LNKRIEVLGDGSNFALGIERKAHSRERSGRRGLGTKARPSLRRNAQVLYINIFFHIQIKKKEEPNFFNIENTFINLLINVILKKLISKNIQIIINLQQKIILKINFILIKLNVIIPQKKVILNVLILFIIHKLIVKH